MLSNTQAAILIQLYAGCLKKNHRFEMHTYTMKYIEHGHLWLILYYMANQSFFTNQIKGAQICPALDAWYMSIWSPFLSDMWGWLDFPLHRKLVSLNCLQFIPSPNALSGRKFNTRILSTKISLNSCYRFSFCKT